MKLIEMVHRHDGVSFGKLTDHLLGPFAGELNTQTECRARRIEVNLVEPGSILLSRRRWPNGFDRIDAVIMRWYDHAEVSSLPKLPAVSPAVALVGSFVVNEDVAVGARGGLALVDGEAPSVKHISLLRGTVVGEEFRRHYRHHVDLVREHLPGIARYVQNEVVGDATSALRGPGATELADPVLAISELSFWTQQDYEHRWARGQESESEFSAAEGFLDLAASLDLSCTEHLVHADGK